MQSTTLPASADAARISDEEFDRSMQHLTDCLEQNQTQEARQPQKRLVYFLGSAISTGKETGLPMWNPFVKALMQSFANIAGVEGDSGVHDATGRALTYKELVAELNTFRGIIVKMSEQTASENSNVYLEPYHMTDLMCRRLGVSYLDVIKSFRIKGCNDFHRASAEHLIKGFQDKSGAHRVLLGIVTTNFDTGLKNALKPYERNGEAQICKLTGNYAMDMNSLEMCYRARKKGGKIVLLCMNFKAFDLVSSLMYHITPNVHSDQQSTSHQHQDEFDSEMPDSYFRFIFHIHGSAEFAHRCVDSNFQREQQLPYGVTQALMALYTVDTPFVFAGYSGGDMIENPDYLLLNTNCRTAVCTILDRNGLSLPRRKPWSNLKVVTENQQERMICCLERRVSSCQQHDSISFQYRDQEDEAGGKTTFKECSLHFSKIVPTLDVEIDKEFLTRLDRRVEDACFNDASWAWLTLQDICRALRQELDSVRGTTIRTEEQLQADLSVRILEHYFIHRSPSTWTTTFQRVSWLKEQIRQVERYRLPRVESFHDPSEPETIEGDRDELLGENMALFVDMIDDAIEMFQSNEQQLTFNHLRGIEALHYLSSTVEFEPNLLPDAWVFWATYITLRSPLSFDTSDQTVQRQIALGKVFWAKACKAAVFSGNVWGKKALKALGSPVYWKIGDTRRYLSAIRLGRNRDKEAEWKIYEPNKMVKTQPHASEMAPWDQLKRFRRVHILGIDNELPVHHHASLPLREVLRVLLIVGMCYSERITLRDVSILNHRVLVDETLARDLKNDNILDNSGPEVEERMDTSKIQRLNNFLSQTELCLLLHTFEPFAHLHGPNLSQDQSQLNADCREFLEDPEQGLLQPGKLRRMISTRIKVMGSLQIPRNTALYNMIMDYYSTPVVEQHTVERFSTYKWDYCQAQDRPQSRFQIAIRRIAEPENSRKTIEIIRCFLENHEKSGKLDLRSANKLARFNNKCLNKAFQLFMILFKFTETIQKSCGNDKFAHTWSRELAYDFFNLSKKSGWNSRLSRWRRIVAKDKLDDLEDERRKYMKTPWRYQDAVQILINAIALMDMPTSLRRIGQNEAILATNPYEDALVEIGCIAYGVEVDLKYSLKRRDKHQRIWHDFSRLNLLDVAGAKDRLNTIAENEHTTRAILLEILRTQLNTDDRAMAESVMNNEFESTYLPSRTYTAEERDHAVRTLKRLQDEFVLSASRSLPPNYQAPTFHPTFYVLRSSTTSRKRRRSI